MSQEKLREAWGNIKATVANANGNLQQHVALQEAVRLVEDKLYPKAAPLPQNYKAPPKPVAKPAVQPQKVEVVKAP